MAIVISTTYRMGKLQVIELQRLTRKNLSAKDLRFGRACKLLKLRMQHQKVFSVNLGCSYFPMLSKI